MEVYIVEGKKIERYGLTTDEKGQHIPAPLLRNTDVAGYEVSGYGNLTNRHEQTPQTVAMKMEAVPKPQVLEQQPLKSAVS